MCHCNPVTIKLSVQSLENCQLNCYNDASFGNLSTGGSQGGYVIFLTSLMGVQEIALGCKKYDGSRNVRIC